jgi:hypothetical protein
MADLVRDSSLHKVWRLHNIRQETLRKFITYDPVTGEGTETPHRRTLDQYAQLFLEAHPEGFVLERKSDGTAGALPPLKMTLPAGEEQATEVVREIFRRAREHPDGLPEGADSLEAWLEKVLRAQYAVEAKYPTKGKKGDG